MKSTFSGGLNAISAHYDGFFVDLWGVVHDGKDVYPDSLPLLEDLRQRGKQVVFLSNAPRRSTKVADFLKKLGVTEVHFNHIVTSGEDAWATLREKNFPSLLGKKKENAYFMGGPDDVDLCVDAGLIPQESMRDAAFILATGVEILGHGLSAYQNVLDEGLERGLPMVCVNPDLVVHIKGKESICAGSLAQYYADKGGKVVYHGKPHRSIYERAHGLLEGIPKEKILGIGDSFHTDVKGALNFGIDVAFVMGGIHKNQMSDESGKPKKDVDSLIKKYGFAPSYHVPYFKL